jgi:hypothetical protein
MPWAAIGAIAALAGSAFSVGDTLYQQANAPGQASAASQQPTQAQAVASETANRQLATSQAQQELPGIQAQTGGGVSPGYYADMSSLLSGNSQYGQSPQIAQLVSSFLGQGTGTGASSTPTSSIAPGLTSPQVSPQVQQAVGAFQTPANSVF